MSGTLIDKMRVFALMEGMNRDDWQALFDAYAQGHTDFNGVMQRVDITYEEELRQAVVDHHRQTRTGYAEVIFCEGKTADTVVDICHSMRRRGSPILGTRCSAEMFQHVCRCVEGLTYNETARVFRSGDAEDNPRKDGVTIIAAGTSDAPVAAEAAETLRALGHTPKEYLDIGVAGLHRLLTRIDRIRRSTVIIAVAGMEGALASVVGGLVTCPVIAVPTSVGYGANFGGLAALLAMLNACATGVTVTNIDNGFGAAYSAALINNLAHQEAAL